VKTWTLFCTTHENIPVLYKVLKHEQYVVQHMKTNQFYTKHENINTVLYNIWKHTSVVQSTETWTMCCTACILCSDTDSYSKCFQTASHTTSICYCSTHKTVSCTNTATPPSLSLSLSLSHTHTHTFPPPLWLQTKVPKWLTAINVRLTRLIEEMLLTPANNTWIVMGTEYMLQYHRSTFTMALLSIDKSDLYLWLKS
jgi:hypothetical protein